jgi:hypothetical protein
MLGSLTVRLEIGNLLGADATTLANANNTISLVQTPFAPNENLQPGNLTTANFTGSTPIAQGAANLSVGVNPVNGQQTLTVADPVGGFRFQTGNMANLPQTIYGYMYTNANQSQMLGIALLPAPVTLTAPGQFIDLGTVTFNVAFQPLS